MFSQVKQWPWNMCRCSTKNSSGTTKARIGIAGQANALTPGSAAGDLVFRGEAQNILFTSNGGSSTSFNFSSNGVTTSDPFNFSFGTTTGTKFGTATTQKLGFYNATPIVQPTGSVLTALSNLGLVATPTISQSDITNLTTDLAAKAPLVSPSFTTPNIGAATGTSLAASAAITSSGTAGIGYATGAGGTVTQATSKATAVALNKTCGTITLNAAALAANTTVSFTLTNSTIAATDVLVLNHASGGTAGAYALNAQAAAGSASINVRNITAGSLSEAIVIRFVLIKAVSS